MSDRTVQEPNGELVLSERTGAGAFGEVFRVRDEGTGAEYAVKVVASGYTLAIRPSPFSATSTVALVHDSPGQLAPSGSRRP